MTARIAVHVFADISTGEDRRRTIIRRLPPAAAGKGAFMPDEDEMEKRLWRTMPWDRETMIPSVEKDEEDEKAESGGEEH